MMRPQASEEKRSHATLCRVLDVSVKGTSVCVVDKAGRVVREVKVATEPVAIFAVLTEEALAIERIGLEAGPGAMRETSRAGKLSSTSVPARIADPLLPSFFPNVFPSNLVF